MNQWPEGGGSFKEIREEMRSPAVGSREERGDAWNLQPQKAEAEGSP